jgi:hypothetical protein
MPQYIIWQKKRGRVRCGRRPADHAHHESVTGSKGTATKPPDTETLPLCSDCHLARDGKDMTKEKFYPYQPPEVLMLMQLNEYLHEKGIK